MRRKEKKTVTIEELAFELGVKPSYLYAHFRKIQERYRNQMNIILEKRGWGKTADYGIQDWYDRRIRWVSKHQCLFGGNDDERDY